MLPSIAKGGPVSEDTKEKVVYLFSSFRGDGEDGLHLAYSWDGLQWLPLKGDKPFLKPMVGGKLMRDPCVIQGPDGLFHMVWTTSWRDKGIGIAHSKDLIDWSEQAFVAVMQREPSAQNCWAPEITWDPDQEEYVIYWATTIGQAPEIPSTTEDHRIYFVTTKNFKDYSKARLLFDPGFSVIDSTITRNDKQHIMVFKDERTSGKNLSLASSKKVAGPWSKASEPFSPKGLWVEGPTTLKIEGHWYVYYDCYRKHRYGAMRTTDFNKWEDISDKISFPKGTRHGTAFSASIDILEKLK
jgi:hypothetical protein